jgi:hypothetical protein
MASLSVVAGLSILLIGDSHLSTASSLIGTLHDDLLKQGAAQVHSIGVCGVAPEAWTVASFGKCGSAERIGSKPAVVTTGPQSRTRPIADLIRAEHPDLLLVVMGDTIGGYDSEFFPINWARQTVNELTGAIAATNTRCVWVGPGWGQAGGVSLKNYERAELVSRFLTTNVAPCTYVSSQALSKQGQWPTMDGMHYTAAGYKAWGDAIAQAIGKLPASAVGR